MGRCLVADLGPVDHQRADGEPASKDLGGAVEEALQSTAPDRRRPAGEVDEGGIGVGRAGDRDDGDRDDEYRAGGQALRTTFRPRHPAPHALSAFALLNSRILPLTATESIC